MAVSSNVNGSHGNSRGIDMTDLDPIEEIHRIRKKLDAEAGNNPAAYARSLRASQSEGGGKVVSLVPKKPGKRKNTTKVQNETMLGAGGQAGDLVG
jgi:hypothetical protein